MPGNSLKLILIVNCHWAAREMRLADRQRTQPWNIPMKKARRFLANSVRIVFAALFLCLFGALPAFATDGIYSKFGLDLGYTKAGHMIWHVYQLAGLVGDKTSTDPRFIAGNYGGEQASIAAGSSAGGNWLYGGSNNQVVLQATQLQDSTNAGYNLAYGIAEISLTLRN